MGMTGGSFKTREFVHGASARAVRMARVGFQVLGFGLPLLLLAAATPAAARTANGNEYALYYTEAKTPAARADLLRECGALVQ